MVKYHYMNQTQLFTNFVEVFPDPTLPIDTDPVYANIARVLNGEHAAVIEDVSSINDEVLPLVETEDKVTTKDIFKAIGSDLKTNPSRARAFGGALMVIASQVADRARVSVVVTPAAATFAMEQMLPHGNYITTPLVTAAAAAVTFFGVNGAIAEGLNLGIDQFPQTTDKFEEKFPKVIAGFTDSLAGLDSRETRENQQKSGLAKELTLKEKIKMHTKRATTIIGIGPTPYVATSAVNGYNIHERRNLHLTAIADTSALAGVVGFSLSETVIQLAEHGHVEQAKHVQDIVGYTPLWLGIAGLSVVSELVGKRLQKRKEAKLEEKGESKAE